MISIIIVSHNTKALTLNCIESIVRHRPEIGCEVIVVDNASTDGTADAIEQKYPECNIIRFNKNAGFAVANNTGFAASTGEYILLLNSDTLVTDGALDMLVDRLESNPELGVVSPRLIGLDGKPQETFSYLPTQNTEIRSAVRRKARSSVAQIVESGGDIGKVGYVAGAAVLIRREVFKAAGGLDESFFFYYEDADFCKRVSDAGWGINVVTDSVIVHLGGGSTKPGSPGWAIEMLRSKLRYMKKHFGCSAFITVGMASFFNRLRKLLMHLVLIIITFGIAKSARQSLASDIAVCLWFLIGMPSRDSKIYRCFIESWGCVRK